MGSLIMGQIVTVPGLQWTVSSDDSNAGSGPLFWIYVDKHGRWCLRKEGDETDAFFGSRAEALAFIRSVEGGAAYRLFIETDDGKVVLEQHAPLPGEQTGSDTADAMPVSAESPAAERRAMNLGRHLEWAHQLESAARVSPSRIRLLAHWLREMWS
jgi:hypothetical protein